MALTWQQGIFFLLVGYVVLFLYWYDANFHNGYLILDFFYCLSENDEGAVAPLLLYTWNGSQQPISLKQCSFCAENMRSGQKPLAWCMSVMTLDTALCLNSEQSVDTWTLQRHLGHKMFPRISLLQEQQNLFSLHIYSSQHVLVSQRTFWGFILENESIQHFKSLRCWSLSGWESSQLLQVQL